MNRSSRNVFVFASTPVLKETFNSHVLSLANLLKKNKYTVSIIAFYKNNQEKTHVESLQKKHKLQIILVKRNVPIWQHLYFVWQVLKRENAPFIVHAQNYYCSFLVSLLKRFNKNIKLHSDIKGIVPYEELYFGKGGYIVRVLKKKLASLFERYFVNKTDSLGVVSYAFADYYRKKYNYIFPIFVFPSVYDTAIFKYSEKMRNDIRKKMHFSRKIVVTYSGNFQKWQNIEAFVRLIKHCNPRFFHFVIITNENKDLFVKKYSLENYASTYTYTGGDQKTVNSLLNASDFCFLVRKPNIVNKVSSPTKFCEYVVTRNKVIISEDIGDFTQLVKKNNVGIVVSDYTIKNINAFQKQLYRQYLNKTNPDFYDTFEKKFSYQSRITSTLSLYKNMF